jgi:hypothetical protein
MDEGTEEDVALPPVDHGYCTYVCAVRQMGQEAKKSFEGPSPNFLPMEETGPRQWVWQVLQSGTILQLPIGPHSGRPAEMESSELHCNFDS